MTEPSVDAYPDPQREREALREERWNEFVRVVREVLERAGSTRGVLGDLAWLQCSNPYTSFQCDMRDFADSEGWPDTLNAIARAMREHETERRELMDRR